MWDIKYRPNKFADVLGQEGNVKLLKARLARGTAFDTSYIFMGGHGQGKTTLARIHARAMQCLRLDKNDPEPCNECENCQAILKDQSEAFSERDAASQGKIEHIREFVGKLGYAVSNAKLRIELFDEAHRIGDGAQDVLLKPIEEKKFVGMFCTTEPNKIKGTIRSRSEEYVIQKVTREEVLKRAKYVCASEGVEAEDDALLTIIDHSGGHIRDILNKMEMIAQVGGITLDSTREYLHLGTVNIYYDILLSLANPTRAIELVERACENVAPDEVIEGLGEAAMNSYRLANNMFTEFMMVDREMGKKVHDLYKTGCVNLADYFLKNKYASRTSLMRDVLLLTQYKGNLPPEGTPPQVQIVVGGGEYVQPTLMQAVPAPVAPTAPIAPQAAAVASPQPQQAAVAPTHPSVLNGLNGHSKPDPPCHKFGPTDWVTPRKNTDVRGHIAPGTLPSSSPHEQPSRLLSPEEWKRLFLAKQQATGRGGSDG